MKVELHCHTKRFSPCATDVAEDLLPALVRAGYGVVYLTEHNVVWPEADLAALQARFPAVRIFPGVEISLNNDTLEHLVVLGTADPSYLAMAGDPASLLARARVENHFAFFAHPFRTDASHTLLDSGLRADAIEWTSCNQQHERSAMAFRWAKKHGVPLVNAGDTHNAGCLDLQWIETHRTIVAADDIRGIVLDRAYDLMVRQPAVAT